ncbi:hypothetical protein B0O80DRAFT_447238 [Mortierella sp. GBAus27b]|nr:hypothetical protein B0O80DRAFT_447238 [Mortierella sp. GBAus27b]
MLHTTTIIVCFSRPAVRMSPFFAITLLLFFRPSQMAAGHRWRRDLGAQRSPKAIETKEQAQFVAGVQLWTMGGQFPKECEVEIQKRIDWSEASVAQARLQAAADNERGHHLALSQSQPPSQPQPQPQVA